MNWTKCRLEYSPIQGGFHIEPSEKPRNCSDEWYVLSKDIDDAKATKFTMIIRAKFKLQNKETIPSLKDMEFYFKLFLA